MKSPSLETRKVPENTPIEGDILARLSTLQNELEKAPKKTEIRSQILELQRELNRVKKYTSINNHPLAKGANKLEDISALNLLRIDQETSKTKGEVLSSTFLYKRTTGTDGNSYEAPTDGKGLQAGDVLSVDFGKNSKKDSAYWKIGLGNMLPVDIGYIKVDGKIGVRSQIGGREGYYTKPDKTGYIPVFTGSIVSLPTVGEIAEFEKKKDVKLVRNTDQTRSDEANSLYIEMLERVPGASKVEMNSIMKESYDFWISKGFRPEWAIGIIANEWAESKGSPHALGDSHVEGGAMGIFQWQQTRRDAIKQYTGIDIKTASRQKQLEAAYWEMTNTITGLNIDAGAKKAYALMQNAGTAEQAADIFTRYFERPGEVDKRAEERRNYASRFTEQMYGGIVDLPPHEGVIKLAMVAYNQGNILGAEHCTDWVNRIYQKATGRGVYASPMAFNSVVKDLSVGTGYRGTHYATSEVLGGVSAGAHIMIDKPDWGGYNKGRTHSVIALETPKDGLVKVVSYPNGGKPPQIETYDLLGNGRGEKNARVIRINTPTLQA